MKYLLDANTYIQAKSLHYRMNVVPGFWSWLDQQFGYQQVCSKCVDTFDLLDTLCARFVMA